MMGTLCASTAMRNVSANVLVPELAIAANVDMFVMDLTVSRSALNQSTISQASVCPAMRTVLEDALDQTTLSDLMPAIPVRRQSSVLTTQMLWSSA